VGELAYDRHGSGEPLVLLHGIGMRRGAWGPVEKLASQRREVFNVDLPGFGESPPDPAGTKLTVSEYADRLQEFIASAGIGRPHLGASSMGGGIGLELARRDAVRSLTAFSPIGFWGRSGQLWCRLVLRAEWELGRRTPESMQTLTGARLLLFPVAFGRPFQVSDQEIVDTARAGQAAPGFRDALTHGLDYRFDDPATLREIPITIAWGRRDVLLPYWTQARAARRLLPHARHVSLPGCGHVPFYDDPDLCARVLLEGSGGAR
jgi:pimeloyl-ACP methyl ester carboxylesterase